MPNLFHRYEEQDNQDELYVVYFFHKWSGQWMSLCPYNHATKSASAMALPRGSDGSEAVHLRLHGDRRRIEVRAQLGLQALGRDADLGVRQNANGGLGAWSLQPRPLKPYYEICRGRHAGGLLPGRPQLHQERHDGRPFRHAPDHVAERDREPVQPVEP